MPTTEKRQDYRNHRRFFPLFHFLASPVTAFFFLHRTWEAIRHPSAAHWMEALYAAAIFAGVLASRIMAITVQNRVIRLEMRLRLREILPPALVSRVGEIRAKQLIALRFASDAELPALVERTLAGEFKTPGEIKAAVKDWQPDFMRA